MEGPSIHESKMKGLLPTIMLNATTQSHLTRAFQKLQSSAQRGLHDTIPHCVKTTAIKPDIPVESLGAMPCTSM